MVMSNNVDNTRSYTPRDRYEIGSDSDGLLDSAATKDEAFRLAEYYAQRLDTLVTVYDRMARKGCPRLWEVHP